MALIESFVAAWNASDVDRLVSLLARDARFSMPPIPSWFDGRDAIRQFVAEQVFARAWRAIPTRASGQLAFALYMGPDFQLGALNVVSIRGSEIVEMTGFLDPASHARLRLPKDLPADR